MACDCSSSFFCVTRQYGSLSKNKTRKCVKGDVYNILEYLTYESISNLDKGEKKFHFKYGFSLDSLA